LRERVASASETGEGRADARGFGQVLVLTRVPCVPLVLAGDEVVVVVGAVAVGVSGNFGVVIVKGGAGEPAG
jgi:hypothetical protein